MTKHFVGGGMGSVRLLVDNNSNSDEVGCFISVANQSLPIKVKYLRWVYFLLSLQYLIASVVSFILYMTPGVRPYVQQNIWLSVLVVAGFSLSMVILKFCSSRSTLYVVVASLLFQTMFTCIVAVLPNFLDSECGYIVPFLLSSIFFCHGLFSLQSMRSLNPLHSSIGSLLVSIVFSLFIQVLLSLFSFNYLLNISLSTATSIAVHCLVRNYMSKFSYKQPHLGWIYVHTAVLPPYK